MGTVDVIAAAADTGVPDWIPVAALVTGAVALIGIGLNRWIERRDRRRDLYATAYEAALDWVEMLYRVRRRDSNKTYDLADRFHDLQKTIDYHQGWIATESKELGRSYRRFVKTVKALTVKEIRAAWKSPPCKPEDGFSLEAELHPNVSDADEQFIRDLRDHTAVLRFWRRWSLKRRYSDDNWREIVAAIPTPHTTTSNGGTT
jgi:hypothetical protein